MLTDRCLRHLRAVPLLRPPRPGDSDAEGVLDARPATDAEAARFGLIIEGPSDTPSPYLDDIFRGEESREAFFRLIEANGLVVARNLEMDPTPYRPVRGRRAGGRLSQGELFHHDGCSSPTRPRVVEIRCPPQRVVRTMRTSIAPFPQVVQVMVALLSPERCHAGGLAEIQAALPREVVSGGTPGDPPSDGVPAQGALTTVDWEHVQGLANRIIRQLDPESAREYFRAVDRQVRAFDEPWTLGESRFMANSNAGQTVQHRRALEVPRRAGVPNGQLAKRWPAEELPPAQST